MHLPLHSQQYPSSRNSDPHFRKFTTEVAVAAKTSYMPVKPTSDSGQINSRMNKRKSSGP